MWRRRAFCLSLSHSLNFSHTQTYTHTNLLQRMLSLPLSLSLSLALTFSYTQTYIRTNQMCRGGVLWAREAVKNSQKSDQWSLYLVDVVAQGLLTKFTCGSQFLRARVPPWACSLKYCPVMITSYIFVYTYAYMCYTYVYVHS